jgi:hypothetical protein
MQHLGANPISRCVLVGALTLLAGCGGGSSTPPGATPTATPNSKATATPTAAPTATPTAAPQRLYVSPTEKTAMPIAYFTSPFTNGSTPTSSFTPVANNVDGSLVVDAAGDVIEDEPIPETITSYSRPSRTTAAQFSFSTGFPSVAMAFGPTGTFFVVNANGAVDSAPSPLSAATTLTQLIAMPSTNPWGITVDAAGNLYVADHGTNNVYAYAPPYTGTATVFGAGTAGSEIGLTCTYDSVTDQLIVDEASANGGNVLAYNLPLASNPTPAANIAYTAQVPTALAVDKSGNLYVSAANATAGVVQVFAPPFVNATNPTPLLSIAEPFGTGTTAILFSMAFGS